VATAVAASSGAATAEEGGGEDHGGGLPGRQFISEYADATFARRGTELHVAPGWISDGGQITEVLEARLTKVTCGGGYQIVSDVTLSAESEDLPEVEVDALAGFASVHGVFTFTGEVSLIPAGAGCVAPDEAAAVTTELVSDVTLDVEWRNLRGSVPVVYSGDDCGGDGICYYRDASARGAWASAFLGDGSGRSQSGFFFQGTYNIAEGRAVARRPSV